MFAGKKSISRGFGQGPSAVSKCIYIASSKQSIPTKFNSFEALLDIKRPALKRNPWDSSHELELQSLREFMEISERAEDNLLTVSGPQLGQTSFV